MDERMDFDGRYPTLSAWVRDGGWLEVGNVYWSKAFVRVLDEGGLIWEGASGARSMDEALAEAERELRAWLDENG